MTPLVLASTSAIRRTLLANAGVSFRTVGPDVDEDLLKAEALAGGASPPVIAERLAAAKAAHVSRGVDGLVIGADQTLDLDGELFDKVGDIEAVRERLKLLRGRGHELHAAVAVAQHGLIVWRERVTTALVMRAFSDRFLDDYVTAQGEAALSSVGCYHLEGAGAQLFEKIDGDYFAILGLPLIGLLGFLREQGILPS